MSVKTGLLDWWEVGSSGLLVEVLVLIVLYQSELGLQSGKRDVMGWDLQCTGK